LRRDEDPQYKHFETNLQVLREVFGRDHFRPGQEEATAAFSAGRDVQLVLPTGAGKSLCYQVPAVRAAREGRGATLVVSPLIALMEDQLTGLRGLGVRAVALHSGLPWAEQRSILDQLERADAVRAFADAYYLEIDDGVEAYEAGTLTIRPTRPRS
jgi:ATP-dependent DNA helicase RecQ